VKSDEIGTLRGQKCEKDLSASILNSTWNFIAFSPRFSMVIPRLTIFNSTLKDHFHGNRYFSLEKQTCCRNIHGEEKHCIYIFQLNQFNWKRESSMVVILI